MNVATRRALEVIDTAARRLAGAGIESARLDAEVLMAQAAGVSREAVVAGTFELSDSVLKTFERLVARREKREPIAYIVGHREFYSLDFEVTPAVLIPRPETELVVSAALESIAGKHNARILDIGTGSGAIAIAIGVNAPDARVIATDISAEALEVAARNARRHHVEDRLTFRRADCFEPLDSGEVLESFDAIAANPPYLQDEEIVALEPDVRGYEPRVALTAGSDGFEILCRIASGATRHLSSDGELIFEVALGQASIVSKLIEKAGLRLVGVINDLAGHPRVVHARRLRA